MTDIIGWIGSGLVFMTISYQVWKQWQSKSTKGISPWLYAGQLVANVFLGTYSIIEETWVFFASNILVFLSSAVGLGIYIHHKKKYGSPEGAG